MSQKDRTAQIYNELKLVDRMTPGRTPWQTLRKRAEEMAEDEDISSNTAAAEADYINAETKRLRPMTASYSTPIVVDHVLTPYPAWTIYVGHTDNDEWVAEYHSAASARYQRKYFASETEALEDSRRF